MILLRKSAFLISVLSLISLSIFIFLKGPSSGILRVIILFEVSFFTCVLLVPAMSWLSEKTGVLDYPNNRKIHAVPMPLLGGVAVFVSFFVSHLIQPEFTREMIGIFIAALLILVVGIIDDSSKKGLSSKIRLIAQFTACLVVISSGVVLKLYPMTWWGKSISIVLSIVWIMGITNATNFLDGMDGLAAGLGAVASGVFFIIAYRLNSPYLGFVSITLCGACCGFLIFNFRPASIFLGDSGATFIGFTLACLGLLGDWSEGNPFISFSVPVVVLGVPIFDMLYTTIERFATGKVHNIPQWFSYTGKDHFHHRLSDHGLSYFQTVIFIYFISLTLGFEAVQIATTTSTVNMALSLAQTAFMFLIITVLMYFRSNGKTPS